MYIVDANNTNTDFQHSTVNCIFCCPPSFRPRPPPGPRWGWGARSGGTPSSACPERSPPSPGAGGEEGGFFMIIVEHVWFVIKSNVRQPLIDILSDALSLALQEGFHATRSKVAFKDVIELIERQIEEITNNLFKE